MYASGYRSFEEAPRRGRHGGSRGAAGNGPRGASNGPRGRNGPLDYNGPRDRNMGMAPGLFDSVAPTEGRELENSYGCHYEYDAQLDAQNFDTWQRDIMKGAQDGYYEDIHEVDGNEILHFSNFILIPPHPNSPPPAQREKPPCCKTNFLGGLPTNVTEDMVKELMSTCGNVVVVRLGKKNYAHVRFDTYEAVDKAAFYAGWRMKIGGLGDEPNTGKIHVDFADAREDQHEYEQILKEQDRERRHRARMERDRNRTPSPPRAKTYTDLLAREVTEKLKNPELFADAASVLSEWLARGIVNSKTSSRFFSMLNSVNSAVRRLSLEKSEYEQELIEYQEQIKVKMSTLSSQIAVIQSIYKKAKIQRNWDQFSKLQRKSLDTWIKQCQDIKQEQDDKLIEARDETEMDLSDDEPEEKKSKVDDFEAGSIRKENSDLKMQLVALENEVELLRGTPQTPDNTEHVKQIETLQSALKSSQQTLLEKCNQVTKLEAQLDSEVTNEQTQAKSTTANGNMERDAKRIAVLSCFLMSQPNGVMQVPDINSYMEEYCSVTSDDVTILLTKYQQVFTLSGGRWKLKAFAN